MRASLTAFALAVAAAAMLSGASARRFDPRQAEASTELRACLSSRPGQTGSPGGVSANMVATACTRIIDLNRFGGKNLASLLDHRAIAYANAGDLARAIADFTEVIRLVPDFAGVYFDRGLAYERQGDAKSALADYLEYRRLAPSGPGGAEAVARVQQKPAAGAAGTHDASGSDQASLDNALGVCKSQEASLDAVVVACTNVIGLNRFSGRQLAVFLEHRGVAYAKEKAYGPAIADFTAFIGLVPDFAPVYWNRGFAYKEQGDLKSALADFLEYRRLAPNDPKGANAVAYVQRRLDATGEPARIAVGMGDAETTVLQQRLTDDGCYRGPIDGKPTEALDDAVKACPSQDPKLRIETGMHVGPITQLAVDAACRIAATTSADSTVRVWSVPDLHLLRTLRLPVDAGKTAKVDAAAVSPDGRWIAIGAADPQNPANTEYFQMAVYIFDASTGTMAARISGFATDITHLAYSPDGRWLAVSLYNTGLKVIDTATRRVIEAGNGYGSSTSAVFGPDGRLYSVGSGMFGSLTRYGAGPTFREEQRTDLGMGSDNYSIAMNPSGQLLAVGLVDTGAFKVSGDTPERRKITVYDAAKLTVQFVTDTQGIDNGGLGSVAWRGDGERLVAGGDYRQGAGGAMKASLVIFDRTGKRLDTVPVADQAIVGIMSCGKGFAVAATDPGLGIFNGEGHADLWRQSVAPDMREKVGDAFTVSADARQVRFGLAKGAADAVRFDLAQATLTAAPQGDPSLTPALVKGMPVEDWYNHGATSGGIPLPLDRDELSRSLAIRSDHAGFVLGTDSYLRRFDARSRKAPRTGNPALDLFFNQPASAWRRNTPDIVWGVNLSADGQIIVAAYGDGTIRWHRWSDGAELLALFVDRQTKRWVVWTPKGYYMASPGGEDLIGWQVNRGWDQAADFFPASRFRARFNRPDIVRLVLDTLDEDQAITQANAAAGRQRDTQPLIEHLPPLIRIVDPAPGTHVASASVTIGYSFRSPSSLPVDRIVVNVNGRPVKEIGLPVRALSGDQETKGTVALALGARESDVGLIAWSGDLASPVAHVTLTWDGAPATTSAMRRLHVLVAGVSAYADPGMKLDFAAKDAADFAKALEAQKDIYYGDVETRVLTDAEVTRASLTQGLDWLKTVATGPDDVSILFLAGHGLTDAKGTYWFFPADANADDMAQKGVSQEEIRRSLQGLKGKVLWFLDTCHAGAAANRPPADMNTLLNTVTAAENGGIVVFASSSGTQVSIESKNLGNGAFTKALVEGIEQGKAAFLHALITTSSLDGFVESRVKELTGDKQTPVMERPPQEPDFTIAQAPK